MNQLSYKIQLDLPYDEAIKRVIEALKTEGFGVLTEIDVRSTIKSKLGKEFRPYTILGACNPPLAHRALTTTPEVGLLLPCNVTVEESPQGGSIIRLLDPKIMVSVGDLDKNPKLVEVAEEAAQKIRRIADTLTM